MVPVVIFLNDKGECRALTVPMPTIPKRAVGDFSHEEQDRANYFAAIASAKESSIRVENEDFALGAAAISDPSRKKDAAEFFTLPDEYAMRVEKKKCCGECTAYSACESLQESVATIYRVESLTKEESRPKYAFKLESDEIERFKKWKSENGYPRE